MAAISAAPDVLPPALIYQGKSRDLQDSWLDDFESAKHHAFFCTSEKGWSSEEIGLEWLKRIFHPYTKDPAGRGWRLLIVDGHNSHLNMTFISFADSVRILLAILPPHSTHRL